MAGEDPAYIRQVVQLPCVACEADGEVQLSPTEPHHVIHDRHGNERTHDRRAIPLCDGHHCARNDKSKLAIHKGKKTWAKKYGLDHEYTEITQKKIERM